MRADVSEYTPVTRSTAGWGFKTAEFRRQRAPGSAERPPESSLPLPPPFWGRFVGSTAWRSTVLPTWKASDLQS